MRTNFWQPRLILIIIVLTGTCALFVFSSSRKSTAPVPFQSENKMEQLPTPSPPPSLNTPHTPIASATKRAYPFSLRSDEPTPSPTPTSLPLLSPSPTLSSPTPSPSPTHTPDLREELAQAVREPTPNNSGYFADTRSQKAKKTAPILTPVPSPTSSALPWVRGQARGFATLSAMKIQARPVVEAQVSTLLKARVRQAYLGVLIDGTFDQDELYLEQVLARLNKEGIETTLGLYLSNGPTMRKYDSTLITALFAQINPTEFRTQILWDEDLKKNYLAIVSMAARLFRYNTSLNPKNVNITIPMLEDNLDETSYKTLRAFGQPTLSSLSLFYRNPCDKCWEGNETDTHGDYREEHTLAGFIRLGPGDGFTLDGLGFTYKGKIPPQGVLSHTQLESLLTNAYEQKFRFFGLWRHQWQGIYPPAPLGHPDERTYLPSNDEERNEEVSLLRHGLDKES